MGTAFSNFLNNYFYSFDNAGLSFMHSIAELNNPVINIINNFLSMAGNKCLLLLLIAFVMCFFKKSRKCGICMILTIAATFIINSLILKKLIMRPRPYNANDIYLLWYEMVGSKGSSSFSFPSGHVAGIAAGLTVFCIYKKNILYVIMSIILVFLMSLSRIYFVVHYPTDCIAGAVLGLICGLIGVPIFEKLIKVLNIENKL